MLSVTLKDDFIEKYNEHKEAVLFDNIEDPYLEAQQHLTPGRIYPVMKVTDDGRRLTIIDDEGMIWHSVIGLFKFVDDCHI